MSVKVLSQMTHPAVALVGLTRAHRLVFVLLGHVGAGVVPVVPPGFTDARRLRLLDHAEAAPHGALRKLGALHLAHRLAATPRPSDWTGAVWGEGTRAWEQSAH